MSGAELLCEEPNEALDALPRYAAQIEDRIEDDVLRHGAAQKSDKPLLQARGRNPDRQALVVLGGRERHAGQPSIDQAKGLVRLKAAGRAGAKACKRAST